MAKKNKPGKEELRYEVITQEDPQTGDTIIPIPLPVLEKLGWKEGTEVEFAVAEDGAIIIRRNN